MEGSHRNRKSKVIVLRISGIEKFIRRHVSQCLFKSHNSYYVITVLMITVTQHSNYFAQF